MLGKVDGCRFGKSPGGPVSLERMVRGYVRSIPLLVLGNHSYIIDLIWWAREGSNLQPDGYEPSALTN